MPGFDRKGPEGQGPMTGRKMGKCTDYGARLGKGEETGSRGLRPGRHKNRLPGKGGFAGPHRGRNLD
ncbi:MAG: DUF5320 domain-containing protein [Bacteroidota bacterium]